MRHWLSRLSAVAVISSAVLITARSSTVGSTPAVHVAYAATTAASTACHVVQRGPGGQKPSKASSVTLSSGELARLKAKHKTFRVATFWQEVVPGNTVLMLEGLKHEFATLRAKYGLHIQITAQADSGFDAAKQLGQINTLVNTHPDAMVGILDDQVADAPAVKNVLHRHIPLIMWDVNARGANPTAIVTANGRLAGCRIANIFARAIGYSGKIASLPMKIKYYPTDQRVAGFNAQILRAYPNIHIVATDGATVFADGQQVGEGILQRFPDLKGAFLSWQDPAMGFVTAAKTLNRNVAIASTDMAPTIDLELAKCGLVKVTAPQRAYDMGETEGKLVVKSILKEKVPKYVVLDDPIVTHANLLKVYPQIFHTPVPGDLRSQYLNKNCG